MSDWTNDLKQAVEHLQTAQKEAEKAVNNINCPGCKEDVRNIVNELGEWSDTITKAEGVLKIRNGDGSQDQVLEKVCKLTGENPEECKREIKKALEG